MAYIFRHYIKTEHIFYHIDEEFTDPKEKEHMKDVVEDIMHHRLLDLVLDELDDVKRVHFLAGVADERNHERLLQTVQEWIKDFDAKIDARVREAELEILKMF